METSKKQSQLHKVSEIELTYRPKVKASERVKVSNSQDVYDLLLDSWDKNKLEFVEQFKVVYLNRANKVLGIVTISTGGTAGTIADTKLIMVGALKANAEGIIPAHNHPSGNLNPSEADIEITKKLKKAGEFLGMNVLDNLIITIEGYYSFTDEGVL
ncbi:JAB domain-containing protein [Galbibacter sp. EGI 63066]|uniref:JAB domain-containing protein n=1 Tax=Galbibacter sp. EGI 63066 TaxID=2993559 RepID=UPI002248B59A|nr:JAB domain-containing protein [Galbibacter sp. EGI 63066]MCX2681009.1 JAB domain-containing protein [Galbibacter sp. EGI 63066]